jgi:hypothetical protein
MPRLWLAPERITSALAGRVDLCDTRPVMTLVRLLVVAALVGGCVKPATTPAAHSTYDFYQLCGDARAAEGVCGPSAGDAPMVDTNLAAPSHRKVVAQA